MRSGGALLVRLFESARSSFKAVAALMILNAVRLSAQAMSSLPAAHTIQRLCSRLSE
jgi:hypothetical protein